MSLTVGPVNVVQGAAQNITPPTNAPWESVVISNLSNFLLNIQVGGQQVWLNPFTENVYVSPSSHAPIVMTPTSASIPGSNVANQVQATFYGPGETPAGAWPVSLTAQATAAALSVTPTQGVIDSLKTEVGRVVSSTEILIPLGNALHNYASVVVQVQATAGVDNLTVGILGTPGTNDAETQVVVAGAGAVTYRLNVQSITGEGLTLTLQTASLAGVTISYTVYGMSYQAVVQADLQAPTNGLPVTNISGGILNVSFDGLGQPVNATITSPLDGSGHVEHSLFRSDGRAYPIGQQIAHVSRSTAGTTALIPALGAGQHALLQSLWTNCAASSGGNVQATIAAATDPILGLSALGGFTDLPIVGAGILCDANTAVNLVTSSSTFVEAGCTYDIVT